MTIDDVIHDFATTERTLPRDSMAWALAHWDEAYPRFATLLEAYGSGNDRSKGTRDALFFAIYLLADKRESRAFRGFCSFLRDPESCWAVLGDGVTEDLSSLLIAMFDGDGGALRTVIEQAEADEFVRAEALQSLAYLTRTGRFTDDETRAYLRHLFDVMEPRGENYAWVGWVDAVASLGYGDLAPQVETLFKQEFIEPFVMRIDYFRKELNRTLADPARMASFDYHRVRPFSDAIGSLSRWHWFSSDPDTAPAHSLHTDSDLDLPWPVMGVTRTNPLRHVGRNDPCPCGSGKKFKKCCLTSAALTG